MKHTLILVKDEKERLILSYSSETAWIPLPIGFKVFDADEEKFIVVGGEFHTNNDTLIYWVTAADTPDTGKGE